MAEGNLLEMTGSSGIGIFCSVQWSTKFIPTQMTFDLWVVDGSLQSEAPWLEGVLCRVWSHNSSEGRAHAHNSK